MQEQENFVSAKVAAEYLAISETFLTRLAREGKVPAHPLPNGNRKLRRTWRFRLSELNAVMDAGYTRV
jgi:excisionase family DNA binding protein